MPYNLRSLKMVMNLPNGMHLTFVLEDVKAAVMLER